MAQETKAVGTRIHIGHHYAGEEPQEDGVVTLDGKGRIQIDAPNRQRHEKLARLLASMANPHVVKNERELFASLPRRLNNGYVYAHVEPDEGDGTDAEIE